MKSKARLVDVAIVGGGLSGLYLAYRLQQQGINYALFEAKSQLGGRILSPTSGVDLGPTWFWSHQQTIQRLLNELGIAWFEQYTQGDVLYQLNRDEPPQRRAGENTLPSCRVEGGMFRMIEDLSSTLDSSSVYLSHPVNSVNKKTAEGLWSIASQNGLSIEAKRIVFAAPPRVLLQKISLQQYLPASLYHQLLATPTWMAAQAKFVAVYETAFWREQGLSGDGFSRLGPMVEVHDASTKDKTLAALFGFIGVPATIRPQYTNGQMEQQCLAQLSQLFGEQAALPSSYYLKDWSQDCWVATSQDIDELPQHPQVSLHAGAKGLDQQRLYFCGAEYASSEAGYVEGALMAADKVLGLLI